MSVTWQPRNDYVLIRIQKLPIVDGISFPDHSIEGKEFVVEALGPKVEGLAVGDKVMALGAKHVTFYEVPNSRDLIVIRQEHVVLVRKGE